MKIFLNIALIIFVGLIVFYFCQMDYKSGLLDGANKIYFYSAIASFFGIIIVFIIKKIRKLSGK